MRLFFKAFMRLFFKAFCCQFGIMCAMKLRPQSIETQAESPDSLMAKMAALLSEKDDVIEQQKKRIAMLEEHLRLTWLN